MKPAMVVRCATVVVILLVMIPVRVMTALVKPVLVVSHAIQYVRQSVTPYVKVM